MFRNLRTLSSLSRALFRPRSSLFQHDGAVTIRRVRVVRPMFTQRYIQRLCELQLGERLTFYSRRIQTLSLWVASICGFWYLVGSLDDEQEDEEASARSKAVATKQATEVLEAREDEENEVEADGEEEDGVEVPSEPPEDSWFIPLGLARQQPQTFYRGSDPEWQSFVEFSHDEKRNHFVRCVLHSSRICQDTILTILQMN